MSGQLSLAERFAKHVPQCATAAGCLEWTGNKRRGYGGIMADGRYKGAHAVAFFLSRGYWPKYLLHSCDNPPCVNPDHLREGTHAENMREASERRRFALQRAEVCVRGHEFTPENSYRYGVNQRQCRTCKREIMRELHRRRAATITPEERLRRKLAGYAKRSGELNSSAVLTVALVIEARRLHASGVSLHALARRYGMNRRSIVAAVRGETWAHVTEGLPEPA